MVRFMHTLQNLSLAPPICSLPCSLSLSKHCRYLNQKRAKLLVCAAVRGQPLPAIPQANQQEPLFATAADMAPHITLGCSLTEAWGVLQPELLQPWWQLYEGEGYLLTWREGRAAVVIKEEGGNGQQQQQVVLLRALWQAAWLEAHADKDWQVLQHQQQEAQWSHNGQGLPLERQQQEQQQRQHLLLLQASLQALDKEFGGFIRDAQAAGWRTEQLVLKVGSSRVQQLLTAGSESDDVLD